MQFTYRSSFILIHIISRSYSAPPPVLRRSDPVGYLPRQYHPAGSADPPGTPQPAPEEWVGAPDPLGTE